MMVEMLTYIASSLGLLAGFFALLVAWHLQFRVRSQVPPKYVNGFLILGSALILGNVSGVFSTIPYARVWPVLGNLLIVVAEVVLFAHLIEKYDVPAPDGLFAATE